MEQLTEGQLNTLLQAPESRKILELLHASNGAALKQAADAAKSGNYQTVQQLLRTVMESPETAELVQRLQKRLG